MVSTLARNWWALALRGLFAIFFGLAAFIWPGLTLLALVLLFGVYALVDGFFAIAAGLRSRTANERWWLLLVEGIAGIIAGAITFIWPGLTTFALLYLIAAWAIITGLLEIAAAIRLRQEIEGEWLLGLGGILSVIFGIFLLISPGAGALAIAWLIGAYALSFGILLLILAFRLRGRQATARVG